MFWYLLGRRGAFRAAGVVLVTAALGAGCAVSEPTSAPTPTSAVPTTTGSTPPSTVTTTAPPTLPPPAPTAPAPPGALPNPLLTPGESFPSVTAAQVCQPGWATSHRDVPEAERRAAFAAYGIPYAQRAGYELDHLISLELGGDNAQANLWPEPHDRVGFPGSQTKDVVENRLHNLVCSGRLDLATAQRAIATNWQTALGPSTS